MRPLLLFAAIVALWGVGMHAALTLPLLPFPPVMGADLGAPDAGGRGGLMIVRPSQRYAGDPVAVDYDASEGFQVGRPVLRSTP